MIEAMLLVCVPRGKNPKYQIATSPKKQKSVLRELAGCAAHYLHVHVNDFVIVPIIFKAGLGHESAPSTFVWENVVLLKIGRPCPNGTPPDRFSLSIFYTAVR